jgi:hypothetical protein
MRAWLLLVLALGSLSTGKLRAQPGTPNDAESALELIASYVRDYYSRAESLVGTESIVVQPVSRSLALDGFARSFVNELRIEWRPREDGQQALATMTRRRLMTNGRTPRETDKPKCMDPQGEAVEPLSMFLPESRDEYTFKWRGTRQEKEGQMMILEFREVPSGRAFAEWKDPKDDDCVSIALPGVHGGRVWAHVDTGAVSRIDMHLVGPVDVEVPRDRQLHIGNSFTVDRSDYSIRYRPVTFRDPDETMLLPSSIDLVRTFRTTLMSSRVTQSYSGYRRFLTGGRVVESDAALPPR